MQLIAISAGRPREVPWRDSLVRTSIFKTPVTRRVAVRRENIEGDEQSDLTVHGGRDKAVYVYPAEHYPAWREELGVPDLAWGAFGENFTTIGLLETEVLIGDRYRIGSAEFAVTQPRMPCYKLGVKFGRPDMVKLFHRSGRNGFYLAVTREGEVGPGDAIEPIYRDAGGLSVADVVKLFGKAKAEPELVQQASAHPGLPESWREHFRERLR